MPRRLPAETRRQIAYLRTEEGRSLGYICQVLGLSKSTVQYILEGIKLSGDAFRKIQRMRCEARERNSQNLLECSRNYRHVWSMDPARREQAALRARETNLRYRSSELPLRAAVERACGEQLHKEAFEAYILKGCGEHFVIDWAMTPSAAALIVRRMATVKSMGDRRRRVAYIPRRCCDTKTGKRLRKLRVEVRALEDLLS